MKNALRSLRFAQAVLATALFVLGLNQAAAQIDPVGAQAQLLNSNPGTANDGFPGMGCIVPK